MCRSFDENACKHEPRSRVYLYPCLRPIRTSLKLCRPYHPERDQKRIAAQRVNTPKSEEKRGDPPVLTRGEPAENPRSSLRQSADGQPSPAEEPRLQGRGLCEQPDAGENDTSIPQLNPRFPSASAVEPRLAAPVLANAMACKLQRQSLASKTIWSCSLVRRLRSECV